MTYSRGDIATIAAFVAGGGLAGVFGFWAALNPQHSTQILAGGVALISIAGAVRVVLNPTPTYTAQVFDRSTGSMVEVKTVAQPSAEPAPPPTYTKASS